MKNFEVCILLFHIKLSHRNVIAAWKAVNDNWHFIIAEIKLLWYKSQTNIITKGHILNAIDRFSTAKV